MTLCPVLHDSTALQLDPLAPRPFFTSRVNEAGRKRKREREREREEF